MMMEMDRHFRAMTPEEISNLPPTVPASGASISMEEVEELATQPMQTTLASAIEASAPIIASMTLTLAWTDDDQGFITSDAPCVFFDPDVHTRPFPYNNIGFAYKTLEISVPLCPRVCALFTWQDIPPRLDVSGRGVAEFNRRTRFGSHTEFVNTRDEVDPYWFDRRLDLAPRSG